MKRFFALIALISSVFAARADLVMRQQADYGNPTNLIAITIRIHGDKIRQDLVGLESGDVSLIKDAVTGDSMVLMHKQKKFTSPGTVTKDTKSPDAALSKPQDTGKSDVVGGYSAEIYAWAADRKLWNDTNGMVETLWVANDFTNYENIKPYLAKLDRANVSFPGRAMQPEISTLPGMVVKSKLIVKLRDMVQTINITLLYAKEEPVDPSIFEAPAGYKEWALPEMPSQPVPKKGPVQAMPDKPFKTFVPPH